MYNIEKCFSGHTLTVRKREQVQIQYISPSLRFPVHFPRNPNPMRVHGFYSNTVPLA